MDTPGTPAEPDPDGNQPGAGAPPAPPTGTPSPSGSAGEGTPGGGAASGGPPARSGGADWPAQATDAIVDVVGKVRDRTTGPAITAARAVVFGLFIAVIGAIVAVMGIIAAIRLLDEALPGGVWLPYLILGAIFVGVGALVFNRRRAPAPSGNTSRS